MHVIPVIESWVFRLLFIALLAIEVWAFVNALRFRPDAYVAAGKRTKIFWVLLTAGAALIGVLTVTAGPTMVLAIIAIVVAGVFLADVLPALRAVMSNAQGPYRRRR